ncbi:DUF1016 family protein [bacterium]|nr:DUF1016 family protein [bacterium]
MKQEISLLNAKDYKQWIQEIKIRYKQSQIKAALHVNSELLSFYWSIGRDIVAKKAEARYGSSFYKKLSVDLRKEIPDVQGLSERNIRYMRQMFELFSDSATTCGKILKAKKKPINPNILDELFRIPWGHIRYIIDNCKNNPEKAYFFVHKTLENNWSRSMLLNYLDTDLYERYGKSVSNFSQVLSIPQGELAQQITKDPYQFDFLTLSEKYEERELKDELIRNIEKFLLELGRGFAYMGREIRLEIGNEEKFADMLFYNVNLHCYVVVEVKTQKFEAAHLGQLGLYVSAVNHLLKKECDNPTVGLLICKSKDDVVAQYSLESSAVPIGISEYELSKLFPSNFESSLPTINEIEKELAENAGKLPDDEEK